MNFKDFIDWVACGGLFGLAVFLLTLVFRKRKDSYK